MEAMEDFVNKYGCVRFESIQRNALAHQYNDLLKQCNTYNNAIKYKKSSKKRQEGKNCQYYMHVVEDERHCGTKRIRMVK